MDAPSLSPDGAPGSGAAACCRALLVAAPASGQGKTSVTAALARWHRRQGHKVRVFKSGADFIDPTILARASGAPVHQLDLFMGGEAHCRSLLHAAAVEADLLLVEGAMGLYDGRPSSADLAAAFGLPVLATIDASAMAETFGALALGLASFRSDVSLAGVVANRIAGSGHARMLGESLPAGLPLAAALRGDPALALPERHLGLVQAMELPQLDAVLDRWADAWEAGGGARFTPPKVLFEAPGHDDDAPARLLDGVRIAVASDEAFSFIYPANLDTLRALGAELAMFSPLADAALPPCDAVWLPGGYPELHAARLAANRPLAAAMRAHHAHGRAIVAECGGLLYLLDGLAVGEDGIRHAMAGVLPGEARMQARPMAIGSQEATLPEGELRGHTFHHSSLATPMAPITRARSRDGGPTVEAVYRAGAVTASYVHWYFPSNPAAVAALFRLRVAPA